MSEYQHDPERDFQALIKLMAQMLQAQAALSAAPGEEWMTDAQTLFIKLFKQTCAVRVLLESTEVSDISEAEMVFVDFSSATILARACIETYIVVHWIFQNEDPALRQFRHGLWRLGGLMDRASIHPSTTEGASIVEATRLQIAEVLPALKASPYLQYYTPKQADRVLKGEWRVDWSWTDEAVRAGFHRKYFKNMYGHFCGFAHSSYISSMQLAQAQAIGEQQKLGAASLQACVHVLSRSIHLHSALFPVSKRAFDSATEEVKSIAAYWNFDAAQMDHLYPSDDPTDGQSC